MQGYRVLLVDDEERFVEALGKRLRARGLRVETSYSGEQALEKAAREAFDVAVLDLAMPGMDGVETLKRLHGIDRDLQVILLTGHGTIEKAVEATKLGAVNFLQKPLALPELLEQIGEAGARRAALREQRAAERISDTITKKGW